MASSLGRNGCDDLVDLAQHRIVVDGIDRALQIFPDEQPDHRVRRHQIDLEFDVRRYFALPFQFGKCREGTPGDVGIKQIIECHVAECDAGLKAITPPAGNTGMKLENLVAQYERGTFGKYRFEPGNPIQPLSSLAVRQRQQVRSKRSADSLKNFLLACERYTADEIDVPRHPPSSAGQYIGVDLEKLTHRIDRPGPRHAALGGNAEFRRMSPCCGDARFRTLDTVSRMHDAEIKLGAIF